MKLSQRQLEVLRLLKEGWELGHYFTWGTIDCWLQKNGLGFGGETKKVNLNTLHSLRNRGLITFAGRKLKDSLSMSRYKLTEKGLEVLEKEAK